MTASYYLFLVREMEIASRTILSKVVIDQAPLNPLCDNTATTSGTQNLPRCMMAVSSQRLPVTSRDGPRGTIGRMPRRLDNELRIRDLRF